MNESERKVKTRIVTDVEELRRICDSQPPVTLEQARRSVQAGVKMGRADRNGKVQ